MGTHNVEVKMHFADDGTFVGLERIGTESKEAAAAAKQHAAALGVQSTATKKAADAARATSLAQKASTDATRSAAQAKIADAKAANADEVAAAALARAQAQLATATAQAQRAQSQAERTLRENTDALKRQTEAIDDINGKLGTGVNLVKAFFGAWAVREALSGARSLVMTGVEFNALMETSKLGIASLVGAFGEITDAQGRVLEGTEKWNAANALAVGIQGDLRVAALKTSAEYADLLRALQEGLGPAIRAGFDEKQVVKFTQAVTQAAAAIGLPMNQLGQEIRGIFEGDTNARVSRISAQIYSGKSKEEIDAIRNDFQLLMKEFSVFSRAGEEAANTFTGALSNLKDAVTQALGEGTTGATKDLTKLIKDLTAEIVVFDEKGDAAFNPEFVKNVTDLATAFVSVAGALSAIAKATPNAVEGLKQAGRAFFGGDYNEVPTNGFDKNGNRTFVPKRSGPRSMADDSPEEARNWQHVWSSTGQAAAGAGLGFVASGGNPLGLVAGGAAGVMKARIDRQLEIDALTAVRQAADDRFAQVQTGIKQIREIEDKWIKDLRQPLPFGFDKQNPLDKADVGYRFHESKAPFNDKLRALLAAGVDGIATFTEFDAILRKVEQTIGPKLVPPPASSQLSEEDQNRLTSFRSWMEQFHEKAESPAGDEVSRQLQAIEIAREKAIDKLEQARSKLKGVNENWSKDLADINATFDQNRAELLDKVALDVTALADWASGFDPAIGMDPLAQKLAKVEQDRAAALRKLEEQRSKLESVAGADWEGIKENIQRHFDKEAVQASADSLKTINDQTLREMRASWETARQIEMDSQAATEAARIALITDSIDQEEAQRIAANERWAAQEKARIEATFKNAILKKKALDEIDKALSQANLRAEAEADRARKARVAGTEEWLQDLAQRVERLAEPIGLSLQDAIVGGLNAASSAFDDFFSRLSDGQLDVGETLKGLQDDLEKTWSQVLSRMLSNSILHGQSMSEQWSQLTASMGQPGDAFFAGAGIGGMVGGFFQEPGNHAGTGGAIGGGIGAAIGAYFGGPGGAKVGLMIGTAIGTAIGAAIQKGEDQISLAVKNVTLADLRKGGTKQSGENSSSELFPDGSIDITEKGLSPGAREDLLKQVHRRVRDVMKAYQSIIDIFPEHVRKQLEDLKLTDPKLNLTGSVENGEIRDEGALDALGDVLGNQLGEAAFNTYSEALKKGLSFMGLDSGKIKQLFDEFGLLQGKELEEAVRGYVETLVQYVDIRGKLGTSGEEMLAEVVKKGSSNDKSALREINSEISMTVASLSKLVDVGDQVAAMEHLNSLATQFYDSLTRALDGVNQREDRMHDSIGRQREQIELAGKTDQQKIDYYYKQMEHLRTNLQRETDPQKIEEMTQRLQEYAGAAFGLAGDNKENRDKLLEILGDVEGVATSQYAKAREGLLEEQKKAYESLLLAGDKLLKAGDILTGGKPIDGGPGEGKDERDDGQTGENKNSRFRVQSDGGDDVGRTLPEGGTGVSGGLAYLLEGMTKGRTANDAARLSDTTAILRLVGEIGEKQTLTLITLQSDMRQQLATLAAGLGAQRKIEISGDGEKFLTACGFKFQEMIVPVAIEQMFDAARTHPDLLRNASD